MDVRRFWASEAVDRTLVLCEFADVHGQHTEFMDAVGAAVTYAVGSVAGAVHSGASLNKAVSNFT